MQARKFPDDKYHQSVYKRYRNFLFELQKRLKLKYEQDKFNKNKDNPKKMWQTINDIRQTSKKRNDATELISDSARSLECLNDCNGYFASVGTNLADSILAKLGTDQDTLATNIRLSSPVGQSFFIGPVDPSEILSLIGDLKNDSAPGLDGYTTALIKYTRNEISVPLAHIFNLSISTGCFPEIWKSALVIPIHKDGVKTAPSNYRPISLLSVFSKLLEKVVNNRLVCFLEKNNLLSSSQFGFRRGKSTENAAVSIANLISTYLDERLCCLGIFLDLAKAFDTVSRPILLRKLDRLGIRGTPYLWFQSYLTNRSQCVRVGTDVSAQLPVAYGIPQGSIIGPTLFALYMNDLFNIPLRGGDVIAYADDTVVLFHADSWETAYGLAEEGLSSLSTWFHRNLLTLNSKKTKYLAFYKTIASQPPTSRNLAIHTCSPSYRSQLIPPSCECESIGRTDSIDYLGTIIDERLSFKAHITKLAGRLRKTIYVMKALRAFVDLKTRFIIYNAICQSLLLYCILVWGSVAKSTLIQLERAQRAVLKVMLNKPIRYSTDALYKECAVLRVRQLFILRVSMSVHKMVINDSNFNRSKRNNRVPTLSVSTAFASRFPKYLHPRIYNVISRLCAIKDASCSGAKFTVKQWLLKQSYDKTESLMH